MIESSMEAPPKRAPRLTRIPFYEELATKLLAYRHRQIELIEPFDDMQRAGNPITPRGRRCTKNNRFLDFEDPTSIVFVMFSRGLTEAKRTEIAIAAERAFGVEWCGTSDAAGRSQHRFSTASTKTGMRAELVRVFKTISAPNADFEQAMCEACPTVGTTVKCYWRGA